MEIPPFLFGRPRKYSYICPMENDGTIKSNPRPCNGHAVKDFFEGLFDLMDSNPIPGSNVAQNEDNDYPDEPDPDTHNPDKYL